MLRAAGSVTSLGAILRDHCATTSSERPTKPAVFLTFHDRVIVGLLMQVDTIIEALEDPRPIQRDKLAALRPHLQAIRAFHDGDHARVIRAIKKRLSSPRLANEVKAVLEELVRDRAPIAAPLPPAPPPPPAPVIVEPAPGTEIDGTLVARFEAEIAADPEARDGYLAYGDYLAGRGDPRGEMIGIGRELAKNPGHKDMLRAHAELAPKLLGPLADCDDVMTDVTWHMGFIAACRLAYTLERFNGD